MGLKSISGILGPDLLWVLASMGHGDEIAVVDKNFSAHRIATKTTTGKAVLLSGVSATEAIGAILSVLPLDRFVDQPLAHMEDAEAPGRLMPVHAEVEKLCASMEDRNITSRPVERFAYYPLAEACFAIVQTGETRPYGNFILKKGVV